MYPPLLNKLPHFVRRISIDINSKNCLFVHVVEITPHHIEGEVLSLELVYYSDEVLVVVISPTTLLITQRPEWWHCCTSDE